MTASPERGTQDLRFAGKTYRGEAGSGGLSSSKPRRDRNAIELGVMRALQRHEDRSIRPVDNTITLRDVTRLAHEFEIFIKT